MRKNDDKNKYVAAILQRHYIGNNQYFYTYNHLETGSYDKELKCFVDKNGNEYAHMSDEGLFYSEIPYAYDCIMEKKDLHKFFGEDIPMSNCYSLYEELLRENVYFCCRTKDGRIGCVMLNTGQLESLINGQFPQEITNLQNEAQSTSQDIDPEASLDNLILNIIDGAYSIEELKKLRETAQTNYGNLENLLDTLNLQIEASEKGESYTKLKDEKKQEELEEVFKENKENETETDNKLPSNRIDIVKLLEEIKKTLIAQDEPARRVITELARKEQNPNMKNRGLLITGSTGVGKTKLMSLIANYLDRPFYKIDATKLTVPGYVGTDIEEELWNLYVKCGRDLEKTEHAVIFLDEIDKKGSDNKSDVSGRGVLNVLLPFIEGTEYDACASTKNATQKVKINTSNMTVILGGAFQDVYNNLKKKNGIGFGSTQDTDEKKEATTKDFVVKAGMPDEFMGRVTVVKLNDMDVNSIKRILKESDESALHIQEKLFNELGVKLTSTDEFLDKIAKEAVERKTGARGLNNVVDDATWEAYYEVYTHPNEYSEVVLTEETANDPKKYVLKSKNNQNKKM